MSASADLNLVLHLVQSTSLSLSWLFICRAKYGLRAPAYGQPSTTHLNGFGSTAASPAFSFGPIELRIGPIELRRDRNDVRRRAAELRLPLMDAFFWLRITRGRFFAEIRTFRRRGLDFGGFGSAFVPPSSASSSSSFAWTIFTVVESAAVFTVDGTLTVAGSTSETTWKRKHVDIRSN